MKRILACFLCLILALSIVFTACESTGEHDGSESNSGSDNDSGTDGQEEVISLNGISGKVAAELLLAQSRLDENAVSKHFDFGKIGAQSDVAAEIKPAFDTLSSTSDNGGLVFLGNTADTNGFTVDGNIWKWSEFDDYSNEVSFYNSYIVNIETRAKGFAELIKTIKKQTNITDMWLVFGGDKLLLTVSESSETLFRVWGDSNIEICNHYVDESGRDVYEMLYSFVDTNGSVGEVYMVYIDGEYYEYCYDYTPADGDPLKYFRPRIIIDNSKGYWNMLCMTDVSSMDGFSRSFNVGNLVVKDDVVYQFQTSITEDATLAESDATFSIVSPDLKNDILIYDPFSGSFTLKLNGFEGVEGAQLNIAEIDASTRTEKINPWGDKREAYIASGQGMEIILSDGRVLKNGDTSIGGKVRYDSGRVSFYGMKESYTVDATFIIEDSSDMSVKDTVDVIGQMLDEYSLEPACGLDTITKSLEEALIYHQGFGKIYQWNGESVNSIEEMCAATDVLLAKFDSIETSYNSVKDLPTVDLNHHLEPLPEGLDFAQFSGFSYGKITIDGGVITADEMIAALPEHVLFDDGEEYVLRLGLRKYAEDGETPSETIVILHGDSEVYSTFKSGAAISFKQGSSYTIPSTLSEGKYLLVAFVATADEGIRVSQTMPIASVDFTNGTVESDTADITYEKQGDDSLVVISRSKLYLEVALDDTQKYDLQAIIDLLGIAVMANGQAIEGAVVEAYDPETEIATPLPDDFELSAGTYRLKYSSASHGGADAYVYCTVTEDAIYSETESESESETVDIEE